MSSAQRYTWNVICQYGECQERGQKHEFEGRYCCEEHKHRDKGSTILDEIRKDHTVCASCYRVLKTVEKPSDYYRRKWTQVIADAVVGFEHPTPNLHTEGGMQYCTCSNVDPDADIDFCKLSDLKITVANLLAVVETHRDEGKHSYSVDPGELIAALKAQGGDLDWEIAIGRAVE